VSGCAASSGALSHRPDRLPSRDRSAGVPAAEDASEQHGRPKPAGGIITTADIIQAAEDGKHLNKVQVQGLMGQSPDAINPCDKHP